MKNKLLILTLLLAVACFAFGQKQGYTDDFTSAQEIRNYLSSNITTLDPVEGEYDVQNDYKTDSPFAKDGTFNMIFFIVKNPQTKKFFIYQLDKGDLYELVDIKIESIGTTNAYRLYWGSSSGRAILENNIRLTARIELNSKDARAFVDNPRFKYRLVLDYDMVKKYPTGAMYANAVRKAQEEAKPTEWTGTGFALTNNYIVTNNHVVDGAKTISIQGINGDFNHKYQAEVVATDKHNDLAIIKVSGVTISSSNIPYAVKTGTSEVGEEVFVLGYPLTSTMGEEIKLTTGVISSKTGFQGDVSIYQISAPIQPGNSGGPLFDSRGNVVGIVSAKHKGAENVGYAIKTSYLKNLMESSVSSNILPQTNKMAGQNLSRKVKLAKNYVYYITCSGKDLNNQVASSRSGNNSSLSPIIQNLINNMVFVEGGNFTMGATPEQRHYAESVENIPHQVLLSSFSIGKFEVTQEEWESVMGNNPSREKGAKMPVTNISWNDCKEFIQKLNNITGKKFRLPTEAEWEYAARGGKFSKGYKYAGSNIYNNVAWNEENSDSRLHKVGNKQSNELGLYDMSGNVEEWCYDWYGSYNSASQNNPMGPKSGNYHICRGGSYYGSYMCCFVSYRKCETPGSQSIYLGFRLAL